MDAENEAREVARAVISLCKFDRITSTSLPDGRFAIVSKRGGSFMRSGGYDFRVVFNGNVWDVYVSETRRIGRASPAPCFACSDMEGPGSHPCPHTGKLIEYLKEQLSRPPLRLTLAESLDITKGK